MKPFPIPIVPVGPGSQVEDETLNYIRMPQGMNVYTPPVLPELERIAGLTQARRVLLAILDALGRVDPQQPNPRIELSGLDVENLQLLEQVLGEGEVSARIDGEHQVYIQESVFAGVWRVASPDSIVNYIEVGPAPDVLRAEARREARDMAVPEAGRVLDGVMNAPSILTEIQDRLLTWRPGKPVYVINLTLLPLSPQDIVFLDETLGDGHVTILSRGYGNCRISCTQVPNCWRVVYFNSQDTVILNTIEITDLPEVVCAAPEDMHDSHDRLADVLQWVVST